MTKSNSKNELNQHMMQAQDLVHQFSNKIRSKRKERNLTQDKLAKLSRLSPSTISRLENGGDVRFYDFLKVLNSLDLSLVFNS